MSSIFGIDLFPSNIEFLSDIMDRDIGQHKDFMGRKDPEVLSDEDNQFVSVKNLELSAVHFPCAVFPQGYQLQLLLLPF